MRPIKTAKIIGASLAILGASFILFSGISSYVDLQGSFGIPQAFASTQYGILGRQAPEIELDTWIDGNGKPMAPVKLSDYRGKVIYLYFFQDW